MCKAGPSVPCIFWAELVSMLCVLCCAVQDWVRMSERVLKLSLPTLYFWLSMFYVLFHLWLNIAAELTTFADREFYKVGGHLGGC